MKSAERTIEISSGPYSSLITALTVLIMAAIPWRPLILAFDMTAFESSLYSLTSANVEIDFGGDTYACH